MISWTSFWAKPPASEASANRTRPDHEDAAAAEQVGEPAAEQQEPAEGEHVGVDDPGEVVLGEVECGADRRQGDVHDRGVEDDHELGDAEERERLPALLRVIGVGRQAFSSAGLPVASGRSARGRAASTFRCGRSRSSQPGSHQARLPSSSMIAGTRMLRMMNASIAHRRRQGDAEQLDRQVAAERERGEDADHDRRGRRDHPAGRGEAVDDRLRRVLALLPLLVDARHQEDLVVHREAEDDREHHHREERLDRRGPVEADQAAEPTPLEDRDDDAERRADAEQVHQDRLERHQHRAEGHHQERSPRAG